MALTIRMMRVPQGGFKAWCPALPGCYAMGVTREEARRQVHRAMKGYIDSIDVVLPRELGRLMKDGSPELRKSPPLFTTPGQTPQG